MRCGFAVRVYVLYSGKTMDRDNVWLQTAEAKRGCKETINYLIIGLLWYEVRHGHMSLIQIAHS